MNGRVLPLQTGQDAGGADGGLLCDWGHAGHPIELRTTMNCPRGTPNVSGRTSRTFHRSVQRRIRPRERSPAQSGTTGPPLGEPTRFVRYHSTFMRILHYISYLRHDVGGPVRATLDLSATLAAAGHEVAIADL